MSTRTGIPAMTTYKLVMPEHLNQFGFLFGGNLLKWVDEVGWMAASLEFPGYRFVTVALDRVEFHKGARDGNVLRFEVHRERTGTSSVGYHVKVWRRELASGEEDQIFTTIITFVRVDESGRKVSLGIAAEKSPCGATCKP